MGDVASGVSLAQILRLEGLMVEQCRETGEDVNVLCHVTHHFAPGLYAREMRIPAGVTVVGKMHRHAHLATVSKGRIVVVSEHGRQELCAGMTFVSTPGVKRAAHALEDTIFITYHPTEKTDLAEIEADVIVPEHEVIAMTAKTEALQ